jgi:hypothetical protein
VAEKKREKLLYGMELRHSTERTLVLSTKFNITITFCGVPNFYLGSESVFYDLHFVLWQCWDVAIIL